MAALETKVHFRGVQGRLELDLWDTEKQQAGRGTAAVLLAGGEEVAILKRFREAIQAVTSAAL